jgi:transposase
MLICGIDWSDRRLDFCLIAADATIGASVGANGDPLERGRVALTMDGLTELFDRLERHAPPNEIAVAVEATQGPWLQTLLDRGFPVYLIPPLSADRFRRSLSPTGRKSDVFDALSNALYISALGHTMRPLAPDAPEIVALRAMCADRNRLVEDRTAKVNELRSELKRYYPAFVGFFGDPTSGIALAFLRDHPTQDALRALTERRLRGWLKRHGYTQTRRIDEMVALLDAPAFAVGAHLQRAKAAQFRYLATTIRSLHDEIEARATAIDAAYRALPESHWADSLPGAGRTLAPALVACFGRDPARFEDAGQARAFMGTAPITRESGRQRSVCFRRACCKFARRTLQLFAQLSMRECAWAKAFYDKQRDGGRRHPAAVRALANKWVKIILAMRRTGERYEEAKYAAACERYLSIKRTLTTGRQLAAT